jgi:uncharacterized protein (TIGR02246 family)
MRILAILLTVSALRAGENEEIREVLSKQQAAWNRGDIAAFMEGYDRSGATSFLSSRGVTRGYDSVLENYRKRYPNRAAMGTLEFTILEVRSIVPGSAALVLGRFALTREEAGGGAASGYFTLLFKKTEQGWKILHDHTS